MKVCLCSIILCRGSKYSTYIGQNTTENARGNTTRKCRYKANTKEGRRAGTPLAGGYFGVLWSVLGDLDYFHAILELPHFGRATNMCCLCQATKTGPMTWCNYRPDAAWRTTCWTAAQWRAWEGRSKSPLFNLSYTSCMTVSLDYLHVKYLGCDMYSFGSVLELLCRSILPGSPEANLSLVWARLQSAYNRLRTPLQSRYRYLTKLSMFIRSGYSKLRGKGSEVRHLGRALCLVFQECHNEHLEVHREILLMLQLNAEMENILEANKDHYAFPGPEAARFTTACDSMLVLQSKIARAFAESGVQLFDLTSKTHLLQHLGMLARAISPRVTWCFAGEDFQKKAQQMAQAAVRGLKPSSVMVKIARKYRLALERQFAQP